ncbi:hypothetical protein NOR51B_428 [Luminiphilus syltensis NOR5-1B]|uniref:Uncharacterized protein n=1 Tax=Luminiphilus syltensis NOR5-1B TaxID=565045 RepID=B8KSX1_9GAMM|nr:hypothetical protein NOR51B_428 [Luminiphilus syltensis NOR5-1B]
MRLERWLTVFCDKKWTHGISSHVEPIIMAACLCPTKLISGYATALSTCCPDLVGFIASLLAVESYFISVKASTYTRASCLTFTPAASPAGISASCRRSPASIANPPPGSSVHCFWKTLRSRRRPRSTTDASDSNGNCGRLS